MHLRRTIACAFAVAVEATHARGLGSLDDGLQCDQRFRATATFCHNRTTENDDRNRLCHDEAGAISML